MTIEELKRALVEVKRICFGYGDCLDCEFRSGKFICPLAPDEDNPVIPADWDVDDWKEDFSDGSNR